VVKDGPLMIRLRKTGAHDPQEAVGAGMPEKPTAHPLSLEHCNYNKKVRYKAVAAQAQSKVKSQHACSPQGAQLRSLQEHAHACKGSGRLEKALDNRTVLTTSLIY
jgi:hypothetical protein